MADRTVFVQRIVDQRLLPGGRLIVCAYGSAHEGRSHADDIGALLCAPGFTVAGEAESADTNGVVFTRIAWLNA